MEQSRSTKYFLISLFIIATILRLIAINQYDAWIDEYSTVFYSYRLSNINADGHTPLFYFLTHLFGNFLGWSEFSIRLFPYLMSVVHLYILLKFSLKKYLSRYHIRWYFIFMCFSSLDWVLSREARMYELMLTLSSLTILLGLQFLEEKKSKYVLLLTFVATLNCFNHATILFFNTSFFTYLFLRTYLSHSKKEIKLSLSFTISIIPTLIYYFILNPKINYSQGKISWIKSLSLEWPIELFSYFSGQKYPYYIGPKEILFLTGGIVFLLFILRLFKTKDLKQKVKISSLVTGPNGLILPFILFHILLLGTYPITNFFNPTYFTSLYPLFILILVDTLNYHFSATLKSYTTASIILILLSFFQLNLSTKKLSSETHFKDFLEENNSYFKVVCDYGNMALAQNLLHPKKENHFLYCFELGQYIQVQQQKPRFLEIFQSNPQASDLKIIKSLLEGHYKLEDKIVLPPESSEVRYYKLIKD